MADGCGDTSSETNTKSANFICGVVEGFYGRPWTTDQRKDLFQKMKKWGMDSYVYAPKDDYKHRAYWRELYTVEEAEHLTGLISAARAQGVAFYYALSPGLDITYSSQKEVTALKRKLEQVSQFGCTAFALLFDDIEPEMSEPDKEIFQSFAHAQVSVTNEIQQHLGGAVVRFLLCPTQYCGTRALPTVTSSEYLTTLGAKLSKDIDIMWTGQKVISKALTAACIEEISRVLRRPPVIWDNLHANDYDQKRMFLGPYSGRSPELIPLLRGVLSNPNCEYNANMVPIRTLAHWANCSVDASTNIDSVAADIKLEKEGGLNDDDGPVSIDKHVYHHRQALRNAVCEWLPEFAIEKNATGPIVKPQPTVCVAAVPIIPILPSVNTCMSLITPTTTTMATSKGPTSITSAGIPTVNTSQLQALADICTTVSSTEMFNPTANPIMNSLISATKVVTNDLLHNPIPPIATSNVALPSEIPVSTVPVAIMGLKSFGDGEILGTDPVKDVKKIDGAQNVENDETMHDLPTPGNKQISDNAKGVGVGNENIVQNSEENGTHVTANNDEDSSADIVVDDFDSKEVQNGAMSIGESPCTLSPLHPADHAMECTPEHETATNIMETKQQLTVQSSGITNSGSPTHDVDVVMTDGCNENGDFLQVNSPAGDMMVESNESNDSCSSSSDVLTVDDLMLLCDLFYLPFEHGGQALKLLQEFNWLKCNAPVLLSSEKNISTPSGGAKNGGVNKSECQEWHSRARRFGGLCGRVSRLARRLAKCNNRELLHDICGYVWDLRAVVGLLQFYVKWLAIGKFPPNICEFTQGSYTWFSKGWKEAFMSGDQEPWVFRGGLTADLQRLMPIDNGNDLLAYRPPTSPTSELYTIRPFMDSDKTLVCDICRKTSKDGMDSSDLYPSYLQELPSDRILGPFLALTPELLLVAEEEIENRKDMNSPPLLGFASAVPDTRAFQIRQDREWAPLMRSKYPLANLAVDNMTDAAKDAIQNFHQFKLSTPDSVLRSHPASMICSVLPHCTDHSAPKRLITCLLAALRANGVFAVHTCINKTDHYLNQFYTKLGFIEIFQDTLLEKIYLGRTF